jgi:hypothetical protein
MKTVTKIIFTSVLSAVAPTFAHAAYLQSHVAYQQNAKPIERTSTVQAARAVRGLDAMAYSPAVSSRSSSQTTGWGNASTPGVSQLKDDTIPYGR